MKLLTLKITIVALLGIGSPLLAAETITYSYDAKGRLVKIVHSGSVNNGVKTEITHDGADNRTRVKVTGTSQ